MFVKIILKNILSDGVPFHNVSGPPSAKVYYNLEGVEVILA